MVRGSLGKEGISPLSSLLKEFLSKRGRLPTVNRGSIRQNLPDVKKAAVEICNGKKSGTAEDSLSSLWRRKHPRGFLLQKIIKLTMRFGYRRFVCGLFDAFRKDVEDAEKWL